MKVNHFNYIIIVYDYNICLTWTVLNLTDFTWENEHHCLPFDLLKLAFCFKFAITDCFKRRGMLKSEMITKGYNKKNCKKFKNQFCIKSSCTRYWITFVQNYFPCNIKPYSALEQTWLFITTNQCSCLRNILIHW